MSRRQPTLREAQEQVRHVERVIVGAKEVRAAEWEIYKGKLYSDGFWIKHRYFRKDRWDEARWPFSDITARCDDCGCVLRAHRDCGCDGFFYDRRWLTGNPAERNPVRDWEDGASRYVCLPCFNRIRPKIRAAQAINETRLLINRIKREASHAA